MANPIDGYDDSNRAFLQAFLSRGVLTLESAKPILAAILSLQTGNDVPHDAISQQDLNGYVSTANRALSPLDLEIRSALHQQTRERYYALVNTTSDTFTQLATTYTAEEIAFVKRLLDAMFEGSNNRGRKEAMCLSAMDAVQLGKGSGRRDTQNGDSQPRTQGLSLREAENVLERLQAEGWLDKSRKGYYNLSPRGLMELKGWLVDTYNEAAEDEDEDPVTNKIKFCHACKDIITMGQRCSNYDCAFRLHDTCTQNFFRVHRSQSCPLCNREWSGDHFVGEKAITTSEAYLKAKRRGANASSNNGIPSTEGDSDNDDDNNNDGD